MYSRNEIQFGQKRPREIAERRLSKLLGTKFLARLKRNLRYHRGVPECHFILNAHVKAYRRRLSNVVDRKETAKRVYRLFLFSFFSSFFFLSNDPRSFQHVDRFITAKYEDAPRVSRLF